MDQLTKKVEEARKQREQLLRHHATSNTRVKDPTESTQELGIERVKGDGRGLSVSRFTRAAIAFSILIALVAVLLIGWSLLSRQFSKSQPYDYAATRFGDRVVGDNRAEQALENQLSALVERVETLNDSIGELESKLGRVQTITNSIVLAGQVIEPGPVPGLSPGEEQAVAATEESSSDVPPLATDMSDGESPDQAPPVESLQPQYADSRDDSTTDGFSPAGNSQSEPHLVKVAADSLTATPTESSSSARVESAPEAPENAAMPESVSIAENTEPSRETGTADSAVPDMAPEILTNDPPTAPEIPVSMNSPAPWVINLMSSPKKADADRFENRLQRQGLPVEQQQVSVKGKTYWRVQITGFATQAEAAAYTEAVGEELGVKDPWIMKR